MDAVFDRTVEHEHLGIISEGTASLEYYWLDRWYNVFVFHNPVGEVQNYYCNIAEPASLEGQTLTYVDLDIDVLVNSDFSFTIVDQKEFDSNALAYNYPADLRLRSSSALAELVELIRNRTFPFTL